MKLNKNGDMRKVFLLAVGMTALSAVAQYVAKGVVTDSAGVSEPYATVRIYSQDNKEKPVKVGVTDLNGSFSQELKHAGQYMLQIKSVGKLPIEENFTLTASEKVKDFGTLIIKNDANTLAGVEVVAQKPLVTTEIDRISYDIQADEDSKTNTIFEMLKKVPMVTVDGEDNIKVNGSSNFKIYKNGRPNSSWSNNPKEVLKSIPASMIKRIEVITEPGAKYDAEGVSGILNIITDNNSIINGVLGSAGVNVNNTGTYGGSVYLTTQVGKLTTTALYHYSKMGKENVSYGGEMENIYVASGNRYKSKNIIDDAKGEFHYGNLEASYEIDTLNLITFSFGGYYYDFNYNNIITNAGMYRPDGSNIYSFGGKNIMGLKYFDFNGKLDYQHLTKNKGEAITLSYLLSTTNQDNEAEESYYDMQNFPLDYDSLLTDSKLHFYEHTFQFDWTRPFAEKHKVEMGLKYILRQNFSETLNDYNNGQDVFTDFDHTTHVGAAYGEYSFNSSKWGARAGLRYELAHLKGEYKKSNEPSFSSDIGDLVPTLSGSYKINDANSLKLNFSVRINRPGIIYLNPAKEITPVSVWQGNPNLKSTRRNSLRLTYTLIKPKITFNTSVSGTWADNALMNYDYVENDVKYSTYANNGKARHFSWSGYAQITATESTKITFNGSLSYARYSGPMGLKNSGWGYNYYASLSQSLPWKLKLGADSYYYKDAASGLYTKGGSFSQYSFSLSRFFLKDDRLTVRVAAQNIFSDKYRKGESRTVQGDVLGNSAYYNLQRAFGVSISYRFGSLNASVKKTNKTISNDDLEGRK